LNESQKTVIHSLTNVLFQICCHVCPCVSKSPVSYSRRSCHNCPLPL